MKFHNINKYIPLGKILLFAIIFILGQRSYAQTLSGVKIETDQYAGHDEYVASSSIKLKAGWNFNSETAEKNKFNARIGVITPGDALNNPLATTTKTEDGIRPGQDATLKNYNPFWVQSYTSLQKITDPTAINNSIAKETAIITKQFSDGYGRALQSIVRKSSPNGNDIVQPIAYDDFGRQTNGYLSYLSSASSDGAFKNDAINEQYDFYMDGTNNLPNSSYPYSKVEYENSALGGIKATYAPGKYFVGSNKGQYLDRRNNTANEVINFTFDEDTQKPVNSGYYAVKDLTVNKGTADITDTEQNNVVTFTNKKGQIVAKKVQESGDNTNPIYNPGIYYVYDKYGRLKYILPPLAVEKIGSGAVTDEILNKYCYSYKYDNEHRIISKKIPGKGDVNGVGGETVFVYDKYNRPVLSQNAEQSKINEWNFIKYDILGRAAYTGTFISALSRDALQTEAEKTVNPYTLHENRTNDAQDYTNNAFPNNSSTGSQILTVNFYDDYNFIGAKSYNASYDVSFFGESRANKVYNSQKGKATASKVYVKDKNIWLFTQIFYDMRGRAFQIQTDNHLLGTDIQLAEYDFSGKAIKTFSFHQSNDGDYNETLQVEKAYTYDHIGRIKKVTQKLNGGAHEEVIGEYEYNELGQLIKNKIGNNIQEVDFKYNFQGQLVDINDINDNLESTGDLFALHLDYKGGFEKTRLDGKLAGVKWKSVSDNKTRAYGYSYDKQGRLTRADYIAQDQSGNWNEEVQNYTVFGIDYDANGNIQTLNRQGLDSQDGDTKTYGDMDRLQYVYDGNRLKAVDDLINTTAVAQDFNDVDAKYYNDNTETPEYTYDDNGNLTSDVNKNITLVEYNTQDKPVKITFGTASENKFITYSYDGTGSKLRKEIFDGNAATPIKTTDYVGGIVYEDKQIAFMHTEAGRIVAKSENGKLSGENGYNYEYHIKDHQGNQRISFSNAAESFKASFESAVIENEKKYFSDLDKYLIHSSTLAYDGEYASLLTKANGASTIGPAISIKVKKGENIQASVQALYFNDASNTTFTYGSTNINNPVEGSTNTTGSVVGTSSTGGGKPDAYLKMVFFPEGTSTGTDYENNLNSNPILSGIYYEVTSSLDITEDGVLVVYVGNDDTAADVIFDELKVSHTQLIKQENHYYPGGMNMAGIEKYSTRENFYQYNQSTEKETAHGLNWYETPFRSFDAQLLRFHQIDMLAESYISWTPYHYAGNDPVNYNDPTGLYRGPSRFYGDTYMSKPGVFGYQDGAGAGGSIYASLHYSNTGGVGGYYSMPKKNDNQQTVNEMANDAWNATPKGGMSISTYEDGKLVGRITTTNYVVVGDGNGNGFIAANFGNGILSFNTFGSGKGHLVAYGPGNANYNGGFIVNLLNQFATACNEKDCTHGPEDGGGAYEALEGIDPFGFPSFNFENFFRRGILGPEFSGITGITGHKLGKTINYVGPRSHLYFQTIFGKEFQISANSLRGASNTLKWGGRFLGGASAVFSIIDYRSGNIGKGELALDLIMTGVGFLPGWGWAISGSYFLIKEGLKAAKWDWWNDNK